MAKDPAFLFYPNDWLGGTMGMSFEEKGAYLELLLAQFNRGHMTEDMIKHMVGHLWVKLKDKFMVDDNGLYYNGRLKVEHERRKNYSESRRNNINGKNQYSKKNGHTTSRMENENINEVLVELKVNENSNWNTRPGKDFLELDLDEIKAGAVKEFFRVAKNQNLTNNQIKSLWQIFKAQHFNGVKYYADVSEVYTHFVNWSNKQNISILETVTPQKTPAYIKPESQVDFDKYRKQ